MRRLAALALVACGSSPPPSPAPLAGHATHSTATTPAPQIAWRDGMAGVVGFDISQLPAIARDASVVVVPIVESDGGRGYPNLRLEVRERGDFLASTIAVMDANEYEALVPDSAHASPELGRRIAAANQQLAALHAEHDLVTMPPLQPMDVKADFDGTHVRVTARERFGDEKTIAKVDATTWLAKPGPRCAQCPPCENAAYLDGVYRARGIDAVVVRIAYRGTDTCWEPSPQLHVIAW